jgi:hypothetical protein
MALESTQPITAISISNLPGGKGWPERKADLRNDGNYLRNHAVSQHTTPQCESARSRVQFTGHQIPTLSGADVPRNRLYPDTTDEQ